ncbi:hypothetical protein BGX23_012721 [Mortierella sp. AD031]|nr:hypothetical protein BGX23_012721 [Mortierella sp. AD031]
MEDLLTITPDLEDLKLIGIKQGVDGNHWDWLRFSKHLRSLSLPLRQIHYSIAFQTQTDAELDDMVVGICPNATKRTLMLHYLTPTVVKGLMDLPFTLTTLDILLPDYPHCSIDSWLLDYRDAGSKYTARPLHQLLCESSNLRHLRTLRMAYTTDLMDVHNRGDMFVPLSSSSMVSSGQLTLLPNQPGIWVCRDLETLALDLHYHRVGTIDGPHYTRIVYGYVSRVCPRLQDLQIKFPRSCTWIDGDGYGSTITDCRPFDLERGLCLLSRLKCLERLKVENSVECSVSELNWLCRSGKTAEHRAQRRAIVDEWTARLKEEATLEVVRLWTNSTIANDILGSGTDDPELMARLKNLGLLQDVKEMVEEMDSDDFVCLPELRQLACGSHLEQTPEKELRSLFYVQPPPKQPTLFSRLKRLSRN